MNTAAVMETLEEETSPGSSVVQSFTSLTSFARIAGSAGVIETFPGIDQLRVYVSASVSGADEVMKAVSQWRSRPNPIPVYDEFRILFYVVCHRAYLESLSDELKRIKQGPRDKSRRSEPDFGKLAQLAKDISDAEVTYALCVDPLETELPLFKAYEGWLIAILPVYGVSDAQPHDIVMKVSKKAREWLRVFLTQQTPDAIWMRDYLALSHQEHAAQVLTTLSTVATSLGEWIANDSNKIKRRYQESWDNYRQALIRLPDQPDTMFAEEFGVRKVFVAPQASYMVIGSSTKSYMVNNVARLLGALVSERLPAGDLRILCGGPGSGKSTVCRMLASELAKNKTIYPIFLRLRRMKEGSDIGAYVEESLRNEGLIDRLSDLRDLPNLVLILDGFDELVMASRARLRHFFNVLREELTTGPLRSARAIVSGRDTLFPNGDGLPVGAHVLTLVPFDAPRVKAWGKKWRALHKGSPGIDFKPEQLLPDGKNSSETPLQHLASWPLTLHLLARVHTKGILNLGPASDQDMEKAFLYRSIMADTAQRQMTQAEGQGRFDRSQMQRFLRFLAWEMYSRETDSLDFEDVVPLVQRFYSGATEAEVAEITDVAIVNAPELTKGEQTGCEFVHKSFSEYLVAEHIAETIERTSFKAAQFGSDEPTWRMSPGDATTALASIFASRLLTPEVQEMFEPMLGCVETFFRGDSVENIRTSSGLRDGLVRTIERLEMMLGLLGLGKHLDVISKLGTDGGLAGTTLEAFANYCAGIMIVGTAAARRASRSSSDSVPQVYFNGELVAGGFWRCIGLLEAGGLSIDAPLGARLFEKMTLTPRTGDGIAMRHGVEPVKPSDYFDESSFPIKLREFRRIHRYIPNTTDSIDLLIQFLLEQLVWVGVYFSAAWPTGVSSVDSPQRRREGLNFQYEYTHFVERDLDELFFILQKSGLLTIETDYRYAFSDLMRLTRMSLETPSNADRREYMAELIYRLERILDSFRIAEYDRRGHRPYSIHQLLERLHHEMRRTLDETMTRDQEISPIRSSDNPEVE
jgi:hypothetical protein